ncbi:N-acetyltransferase [Rhodotorula toruloides]|uniref:N-alpha-acetyltransferase 40 n=1 Tax=Rhodotorula toruloides TaxID=5286 RepID=A0A511K7M7_RHOTO|nr:N-acetyltransferase [Rhodotorula toruloides]
MPKRAHLAVTLAKQASQVALGDKLRDSYGAGKGKGKSVEVQLRDQTARLDVLTPKGLSAALRDWIWTLFEQNMRTLYETSSEGYNPAEKRNELFHPDSRFLILYTPALADKPIGYCIFRFDTEETASDDDDELYDVAYELQVDPAGQRQGVGRVLMEALERIAKAWKMDKTMLTVFKANREAILFYEKTGYTEDEVDPGNFGLDDDVDYWIMSKTIS